MLIFQDDKTRVAIGDEQDYINASYIRMQVGDEEYFYISCQGPLPSTVTAFWRMIWENKSDVVAMMTQEVERGRIKCHKYWPERLGTSQDAGGYQLHLENQQFLEYFHIKVIRMVEKEVRGREDRRLRGGVFFFGVREASALVFTAVRRDSFGPPPEVHTLARSRRASQLRPAGPLHPLHEGGAQQRSRHGALQRRNRPRGRSHLHRPHPGPHRQRSACE